MTYRWPNKITPANAGERLGLAGKSRVSLGPRPGVAEFRRSLRREVASTTAERGLVLTQPCLSRQVFYGSRRLAGGSKPLPRVWSLPNNVVNLGASIWGDASPHIS